MQEAAPRIINFKRVSAAEIGGDGRRRVHEEEARRGPDACVHRAACEFDAVLCGARLDQTDARLRFDLNLADVRHANLRARVVVRL